MDRNNAELFLIGKRMDKKHIVFLFIISILCGCLLGVRLQSLLIAIFGSIILNFIVIILLRDYYWIVTPDGLYTLSSSNILKYIFAIYQYILTGDEKSQLIFINYRDIDNIDLILDIDINFLELIIYTKKGSKINLKTDKKEFNQDLINAVYYMKKKGVVIHNIDLLDIFDKKNSLL